VPTITAFAAAFDAKTFNDRELLKSFGWPQQDY